MVAPEFVVVEEADGAVYSRDEQGRLFTQDTAQALADELAGGRKPGRPATAVYRLTRVSPGRAAVASRGDGKAGQPPGSPAGRPAGNRK